eukprot:TRINITY_DN9303_c0_g1_i1.p2 TRINITY_DN9303_c0_g1~~TRINITY_DN9303_c0_g1_i1.p2  ORF type:complete len:101 (+),score=47.73 TRINITY_DN9303_c0_g1_i1:8-310(+)
MIRRPPRSTQSRSSAASDVYKRQIQNRSWRSQKFSDCTLKQSIYCSIPRLKSRRNIYMAESQRRFNKLLFFWMGKRQVSMEIIEEYKDCLLYTSPSPRDS